MNWFACNDGRLINLDQVTDIDPSTVYRRAGEPYLSITFQTGDEEIEGAWLNLNGPEDNPYLLIDDTDLARLRALLTNPGGVTETQPATTVYVVLRDREDGPYGPSVLGLYTYRPRAIAALREAIRNRDNDEVRVDLTFGTLDTSTTGGAS